MAREQKRGDGMEMFCRLCGVDMFMKSILYQ